MTGYAGEFFDLMQKIDEVIGKVCADIADSAKSDKVKDKYVELLTVVSSLAMAIADGYDDSTTSEFN